MIEMNHHDTANEINRYLEKLSIDMQLHGYTVNTQRIYNRSVCRFLEFCNKPVATLGEADARAFLLHLKQSGSVCTNSINTYHGGLRFFFAITLNRTMNYLQMPRFKRTKALPEILSRDEINILLSTCSNLKHKAILMLAYGSGLRVSEICSLKICDIDSTSMRVFVRKGKGEKDRYTILSQECLYTLREYWKAHKPKHPEGWLFLGIRGMTRIVNDTARKVFEKCATKAGITKNVSIHTLRHCFATHLLEDGVDIFVIKELLGHASLNSTTVYLHLANVSAGVTSPIDNIQNYG